MLRQAGTGSVTLGGALSFDAGTSLVCANLVASVIPLTAKTLTFADASAANLKIEGSALADGVYPIISLSDDTVPDSYSSLVLSGSALTSGNAFRLDRSADKKMLVLTVYDANTYAWTGAGDGEKFSNPANWQNANVPSTGGEIVHFPNVTGTLDNDLPAFAPKSIVFSGAIGALAINGNDINGVTSVTNLSTSVSPVINAAVRFAGAIQVKQPAMDCSALAKTHVVFAGGAFTTAVQTITSRLYIANGGEYVVNGKLTTGTGECNAGYSPAGGAS